MLTLSVMHSIVMVSVIYKPYMLSVVILNVVALQVIKIGDVVLKMFRPVFASVTSVPSVIKLFTSLSFGSS
jgi:hypothetical protein